MGNISGENIGGNTPTPDNAITDVTDIDGQSFKEGDTAVIPDAGTNDNGNFQRGLQNQEYLPINGGELQGDLTINSSSAGTASLSIKPTAPGGTEPVPNGLQATARVSTGRNEAAGLWGYGGLQIFGSGESAKTLYELLVSIDTKTTTPPAGLGGISSAWTEATEITLLSADSGTQGIVIIVGAQTPSNAKAALFNLTGFFPAVAGQFTLGTPQLPWGMAYATNIDSFLASVVSGALDPASKGVAGIEVNGTGDYTLTLEKVPAFPSVPLIMGGVSRGYTFLQDGTSLRYVFTDSSGAAADTDFIARGV
jgi:hypothetical protein